ncbi:hypothetical protein DX933_09975 [Ornithinibacillus gellani]|uniref:hypothetical protein n=1 Tax=Ornithinibacillus gellani TaxID=2293253 RepID=UPI000F47847B|nr:hypothetical protein [Ornithinibacillus gellani]TQS75069.1 hypothetical protein DX933_09975 [Ornithinibacillus gellani]
MLKRRIIVALLSAMIFSLTLAYISYTPIAEREANAWYDSFGAFIQIYLLFSVPAYLLGGVPISLYIDKYIEKGLMKLFLYLAGGFLVGVATIAISFLTVGLEILKYGVVGSFASLLFFVLMMLAKQIKENFTEEV